MVTIWDVAERAGVSKSTVSLVLNNSPRVRAETREKVLHAIDILKYAPNSNARNLQRRNNNSIGIIHVLRTSRDKSEKYGWDHGLELFSHDVEDGIFEAIMECDTDMSVIIEHFNIQEKPHEMPRILRECRVDGAILIGGFDKLSELKYIEDIKVPSVLVTSSLEINGIDTVMHDPALGSKIAYKKLFETGHRKICLLNIPKSYRVWSMRVEGARAAANEAGCTLNEELLVSVEHNTAHSAYQAMNELLEKGAEFDAVLAADNELAMGALRCFHEHGLRVPEDVSMICYEDSALCGNFSPAITAVNIQKNIIGRKALNYLLERLQNPKLPTRSTAVEPYLVMRDSVQDR